MVTEMVRAQERRETIVGWLSASWGRWHLGRLMGLGGVRQGIPVSVLNLSRAEGGPCSRNTTLQGKSKQLVKKLS